MKIKEKLRICYKSEEIKETWWLNAVVPHLDPRSEKGKISGETYEIWTKTVVLNQR